MGEFLNTRYKILHHKLKTETFKEDPNLKKFRLIEDSETPNKLPTLTGALPNVFLGDPVDFENIASPLHWTKLRDVQKFKNDFESVLSTVRQSFLTEVQEIIDQINTFVTTQAGAEAFFKSTFETVDLTRRIIKSNTFSTKLNEFDNTITFDVRQEPGKTKIEENDLIEVLIDYNASGVFSTRYIGAVVSASYSRKYGGVPAFSVVTFGVSKFLGLSRVISSRAIPDADRGIDVTNNNVNIAVDAFNAKTAGEVFALIMNNVLQYKEVLSSITKTTFEFDEERFKISNIVDFKLPVFPLLSLMLFRKLRVLQSTQNQTLKTTAIIEHGEHKLFNDAMRSGFGDWYSQLTKPSEVLSSIRDLVYYDIFENRAGQIVMRPQRYNSLDFYVNDPVRKFKSSQVITSERLLDYSYSRDDSNLKTRVDYKWMLPFLNAFNIQGGFYSDPNILIKYGMRTDGPKESPLVINEDLGMFFSALELSRSNALTRVLTVKVPDDREYELGILYYIEPLGRVGYLASIDTNIGPYGATGTSTLSFTFVRNVVEKQLKDLNDALLFYIIYGRSLGENSLFKFSSRDLSPQTLLSLTTQGLTSNTLRDIKIVDGIIDPSITGASRVALRQVALDRILEKFRDTKFVAFKVLPTIIDLIDFVLEDEKRSKDQRKQDEPKVTTIVDDVKLQDVKVRSTPSDGGRLLVSVPMANRQIITDINTLKSRYITNFAYYEQLVLKNSDSSIINFLNALGTNIGNASQTTALTPYFERIFSSVPGKVDQILVQALVAFDINMKLGAKSGQNIRRLDNFFKVLETNVLTFEGNNSSQTDITTSGSVLQTDTTFQNFASPYFTLQPIVAVQDVTQQGVQFRNVTFKLPPGVLVCLSGTSPQGVLAITSQKYENYDFSLNMSTNKLTVKRGGTVMKWGSTATLDIDLMQPFVGTSNDITFSSGLKLALFSPVFELNPERIFSRFVNTMILGYRTNEDSKVLAQKLTVNSDKKKFNPDTDTHRFGLAIDFVRPDSETRNAFLSGFGPLLDSSKFKILPAYTTTLETIMNSIFDKVEKAEVNDPDVPGKKVKYYHAEISLANKKTDVILNRLKTVVTNAVNNTL